MAIEWMDNFELYGTGSTSRDNLVNGAYAEAGDTSTACRVLADPDPNVSGLAMQIGSGSLLNGVGHVLRKVLSGTTTTVGVSLRVWLSILPASTGSRPNLIDVRSATNTAIMCVWVLPTGAIRVMRGASNSGTTIGETTGPVLVANAWQHVEIRCDLDSSDGAVQIRVEGITVLNLTGVNTSDGDVPCAQVSFRMTAPGTDVSCVYWLKDLVIWNGAGSYNNDFIGSVRVIKLVPNADEVLNWTPSTGSTGWNLLDNNPPLDGTQFISAADPPPGPSEFQLTNLPVDVVSVRGVMTVHRSRKVDGGDGKVEVSVLSGTASQAGADRPITAAFTYWSDVFEEDPNTSAPWTPAAVDAARIQIDRTL